MIRILLADDQNIVRQGIQALLEPSSQLQIVGTTKDGNTTIEQVGALLPDIVLIDIEMPGINGIVATKTICEQFPQIKVIILSSHQDPAYVQRALQAGAERYLVKDTLAKDLEKTILLVHQGCSNINTCKEESAAKIASKKQIKARSKSKQEFFSKFVKREFSLFLIISTALIILAFLVRSLYFSRLQPISTATATNSELPQTKRIAALGRIEPKGEVISLSAPTSLDSVKVEQLFVQVGDRVEKGQLIAIINSRQRQEASLAEANAQLSIAELQLEKVKAGAKIGAIRARKAAVVNVKADLAGKIQTQQANISRLKAELENAQAEFERSRQLYEQGAISTSNLDEKKLSLDIAKENLNESRAAGERMQNILNAQLVEAQSALEEIEEVSPLDVEIAQAELKQAQAAVRKAEADLESSYVRAPVDSDILDIYTYSGEAPSEEGIVAIGQTDQMMVVAEIDQNNIAQIKLGQKAIVTSGVFQEQLYGSVAEVGSLIGKNDILDTDPVADQDSRVIEVKILLESKYSQKVIKLTNLEVDVVIEL